MNFKNNLPPFDLCIIGVEYEAGDFITSSGQGNVEDLKKKNLKNGEQLTDARNATSQFVQPSSDFPCSVILCPMFNAEHLKQTIQAVETELFISNS